MLQGRINDGHMETRMGAAHQLEGKWWTGSALVGYNAHQVTIRSPQRGVHF